MDKEDKIQPFVNRMTPKINRPSGLHDALSRFAFSKLL